MDATVVRSPGLENFRQTIIGTTAGIVSYLIFFSRGFCSSCLFCPSSCFAIQQHLYPILMVSTIDAGPLLSTDRPSAPRKVKVFGNPKPSLFLSSLYPRCLPSVPYTPRPPATYSDLVFFLFGSMFVSCFPETRSTQTLMDTVSRFSAQIRWPRTSPNSPPGAVQPRADGPWPPRPPVPAFDANMRDDGAENGSKTAVTGFLATFC